MTRWPRRVLPAPPEPPEWFRAFHEGAWEEPDEHELSMGPLSDEVRRWHRERRWHAARVAWMQVNPGFDFVAELRLRVATRRREVALNHGILPAQLPGEGPRPRPG